ncbi:uncharacterized protein N7479_005865 [Penicillium vulpinum]|uniref:Uncharacterized protein n=1 Tax=Penicillium vulpinum TaxID=29845 RepID=A0A1V6SEL6_9EURO|nr:uncharacterized protein N7479_005865 [Penicillium vulpinum]KAJ5958715.1 hypothetical protein N7479_005865 [Penicillium vulpinum]OQE12435.1 hypothetical protein PENVUL_c001G04675 [Penicillium vulpinum]
MSFFSNTGRFGMRDTESDLSRLTQASHLPKASPATLLNITKLRADSSLTAWGNEIVHVLQPFKLEALVDIDLPRPNPGDANYSRWKFWTLVVAGWLLNQVDTSLQSKVKGHSSSLVFADEIFSTIKLLSLQNQSDFITKEIKRWEDMKREDFPMPANFILAYQNQFNRLKTENHAPTPEFALSRLLQALHGEIMKIPFIQEEVRNLERPVDYKLFVYYCKVLVEESRKPTVSTAGDSSPEIHREARGRIRERDISYRGWRQSTKGQRSPWE